MDFGSLRGLALDTNFTVHGVPATVQLTDGARIATRVIWLTTDAAVMPVGAEFSKRDPIRVLVVRRDEVPSLPRLSRVHAPEQGGGPVRTWIVDAHERTEADQHRVIVVRDPNEEQECDA